MPPKNTTPPKRHKTHFAPRGATSRLQSAIKKAGEMRDQLKKGNMGIEELATATLLQGIVSGDVISASIITRQRLQRENLRLRARLTNQKLRESHAKERLLQATAEKAERQLSREELTARIREIYGLPVPKTHQLPTPTQNRQETGPHLPQDATVEGS